MPVNLSVKDVPDEVAAALRSRARCGITWVDPDPTDIVLVARETGLTTYDASDLCLAGMLGAELLTRDATLAAALDPFTG